MDYVGNLITAQTFLLKKYKELKNKKTSTDIDQNTSDYYRDKYNTVNGENLQLKELVSQYELQIFNFKKCIKEKDRELEKLKKLLQM